MRNHKSFPPKAIGLGLVGIFSLLLLADIPDEMLPFAGQPAKAALDALVEDASYRRILNLKWRMKRNPAVASVRSRWGRLYEHHEAQLMEARALQLALNAGGADLTAADIHRYAAQAEEEWSQGRLQMNEQLDFLHDLETRTSRPGP